MCIVSSSTLIVLNQKLVEVVTSLFLSFGGEWSCFLFFWEGFLTWTDFFVVRVCFYYSCHVVNVIRTAISTGCAISSSEIIAYQLLLNNLSTFLSKLL